MAGKFLSQLPFYVKVKIQPLSLTKFQCETGFETQGMDHDPVLCLLYGGKQGADPGAVYEQNVSNQQKVSAGGGCRGGRSTGQLCRGSEGEYFGCSGVLTLLASLSAPAS